MIELEDQFVDRWAKYKEDFLDLRYAQNQKILKALNDLENRIETAKSGIHDSQEWIEDSTKEYTPTGETYEAWIDSGFEDIREMIESF